MANVKISELPLTLSVSPTALIPVVQNGTTCSTYACLIGGSSASGTSGTSGAAGAPGTAGAAGTAGTSGGFGAVIIAGSGELSSVRQGVGNVAGGEYSFAGGGLANTILPASTITQTFPVTANTVNSFNVTGNVSNFFPSTATPVTPPAIGDSYGGGKVAYILQPGDIGYDPLLIKGLISQNAATVGGADLYFGPALATGATLTAIGTGAENTALIKSVYGDLPYTSYAAGLAASVTDGGFNDWYLPSKDELNQLWINAAAIGAPSGVQLWTSSEIDTNYAWLQDFLVGSQISDIPKSSTYYTSVIAIRSVTFGPSNLYAGTDLVEATFRGTAGTSGVTLSDWGANFSYPTTYLTGNENIGAGPYDNVVLSFTDFGGEKSTIVGGQNNKVDGAYSFVGGAGGTVSSFGTSGSNTICQNADYSFIGAGGCNTIKPAGNVVSINQLSFVYTGSTAGNYSCSISPCATSGVGAGLSACVSFCSNVPVSVTPSMSGAGFKIGDTVTFAGSNWTTPPVVGEAYGGGYVTYILQPGDAGYDAGFTKGLIVADSDQGTAYWGPSETTGATGTGLSVGAANTTLIKSVYGDLPYNTYAAGLAAAYTGGGFNDWYLPSQDELNTYYIASHTVGGISYSQNFYWSSSEVSAVDGRVQNFSDGGGGTQYDMVKSEGALAVRAFRSFSIPSGDLTATIYEIDTVKNNAILGGFGNTIACVSNAGVFGCNLTNTQANTFMANNFVVGDLAGNAGCGVALDANGKMCLAPGASPSPIVVGSGTDSLLGNSAFNNANGPCSAVYGGQSNNANCNWSFVGGGYCNNSNGFISSLVGGLQNGSTSDFTFVGGGVGNAARRGQDAVVGGSGNTTDSSIGGYSFIGGGNSHQTLSANSAILGGGSNRICYGGYNAIAGGCCNTIQGGYQTVSNFDFIGGGCSNTINHFSFGPTYGGYSAILGGSGNCVTGSYTAAFGCNLVASANNTFYVNDMCVCGTLYKAAGSFKISHPDPIKEQAGETLRHSFVESATAGDNIYRYSVTTSNGVATLELPDYYKFLNENDQVWVSPVGHFGSAYGVVNADQTAVDLVSSVDGEYNVLIIGTRKDKAAADAWKGIGS